MIFDKERVEIFDVRYLITSTLEKICNVRIFLSLIIIIINVHPPIRKLPLELFLFFIWTMIMLRLRFRVNILIEIINEFEKESG